MADVKISELPLRTVLTGREEFLFRDLNENGRSNVGSIGDFAATQQAKIVVNWTGVGTDDGAAIENAIATLKLLGGGTVVLGAGIFNCTGRTFVLPESRPFGDKGVQINIEGQGQNVTILRWLQDLGEGSAGIYCGDPTATRANNKGRYNGAGMYLCTLKGFTMQGPFSKNTTPGGAAQSRMDGIAWGSRCILEQVDVHDFRYGITIVGDHVRWQNVDTQFNEVGLYFAEPSQYLYGDFQFDKCMFTGCSLAAIGIHPTAYMPSAIFNACYVGGAPFGIMKQAKLSGVTSHAVMMESVVFNRCMFEYIGNAMLEDRSMGDTHADASSNCDNIVLNTCYFQWDDGNKIANEARRAIFNVSGVSRFKINGWGATFSFRPGATSFFRIKSISGFTINLRWSEVGNTIESTGKPIFDPSVMANDTACNQCRWEEEGRMGGQFFRSGTSGSEGVIAKNDYVQRRGSQAVKTADTLYGLGIALCSAPSNGFWFPVIRWAASTSCNISAGNAAGKFLYSGPNGQAVGKDTANETGQRIGMVVNFSAANVAFVELGFGER